MSAKKILFYLLALFISSKYEEIMWKLCAKIKNFMNKL